MVTLPYRVVDADNHYYEPRDCFTRHIERRYADRAVRVVSGDDGRERVLIGERPFTYLRVPFPEEVTKPGALREMMRNMAAGTFAEANIVEPMQAPYVNRDARLELMGRQGIEAALLLPTLGVTVEHFMKDDVDLTYANLRAFNRWLEEDWGFAYQGRIFAAPLLSLLDVDQAVGELDHVLARGARAIHLRPGPAGGRSPADPVFDPFWARVEEAGVVVAFHISESGYNEMYAPAWGEAPNPSSHRQSAFQWTCFFGDRPIIDTVAALIFHNLFGRFPGIRVASIENGSVWVPYLLKAMDKMRGMGRNGPWLGGPITARPSEIFRQHVFVSPYHEEDVRALVDLIGPSQVIFGSDYPHPEGLAEPVDFVERLGGLDEASVRRVMRDNAVELLGI